MKTKHPFNFMLFRVVTYDGDIRPLFIFPHGLTFNSRAYIKWLEEVTLSEIEKVTAGRPYVWKPDFVPCHTKKENPVWLWENFCDHITPKIWTLNSPDCNPLDNYVWATVEWETNKTPYNTKYELRARIISSFTSLNNDTVLKERLAGNSKVVCSLAPIVISLNISNL